MTSRPSDQPYDPNEYDPDFSWDYDIDNPTVLRETCRDLRRLRKAVISGRYLQEGLCFTVTFPRVFRRSTIANARELPLFATTAGTYSVSQVCVAEPKAENPSGYCVSPRHLAHMEDLVYGKLESLQGTVIPYYFGLHKLTIHNREVARVLVLFMEYVDGVTVPQWKRTYVKHENLYSDDEDDDDEVESGISEDSCSSSTEREFEALKFKPEGGPKLFYLEEAKQIFPLALRGITEINSLGVAHQDVRPENMIIYPNVKSPQGFVFIDFARSCVNIPREEMQAE
ncbi:hypothetical protein EV421DRAFT_1908141 [Armillaria borealis]|uniref:Protein kinase domain-containing protein n=1 Tax=Armillaria borealis TaxID=47425 RepID=A0AA39J6H4_9AGAR|nr:hypothetical protein EV421DRAFT_1908141 [Armillaria borealis]